MKTKKYIKFFILIAMLSLPLSIWGQCASLYQKGETSMKKGKYKEAIKAFKAAMICDDKLTTACESKIKACENKINPAPKETPVIEVSRLTINRNKIEFGCETQTAEIIKVESLPKDWTVSSDADWCQVVPREKILSITCKINGLTTPRKANITINNERMKEVIIVTQNGQKAFLEIPVEKIEFNMKGEIKELEILTNDDWSVADIPEWCTVIAKDSRKLILKVEKTKKARIGSLVITSKEGEHASVIIAQKRGKLF